MINALNVTSFGRRARAVNMSIVLNAKDPQTTRNTQKRSRMIRMLQIGEVYRVFGDRGSYSDVQIHSMTETDVHCQRMTDGVVFIINRKRFEGMRKQRLDQSAVYGQDCIDGRCEM